METLLDREINSLVFDPPALGCVLYTSGLPGGSSKLYDRSPYGNHGSITGGTWTRRPNGLWFLSFDGSDDYVSLGNPTALQITQAITVKFWGYLEDYSSDTYRIIARYNVADGYTPVDITARYGRMPRSCTLRDASNNVIKQFTDAGDYQYGRWWHIVFTYHPNGYVAVFKNGALWGEDTVTPTALGNVGSWFIGALHSTPTNPFKGRLALVEIWNRGWIALDAENSYNREKRLFGVW